MKERTRVLLFVSILGAFVLGFIGLFASGQPRHAASQVVVEDTAGVLYRPQLEAEIKDIRFYRPVTVAVYTVKGTADWTHQDFNGKVLEKARTDHPEWLSADRQKWADGLYVVALDPAGRKVGTYFGEDVKVSADTQKSIQSAAGKLYRDAQWTDGTVKAVSEGADQIGRPWYRSPGWAIVAAAGAGTTAVVGGMGFHARRKRKEENEASLAAAREHFANVTRDLGATELHARYIPESSRYGSLMLGRFERLYSDYRDLVALDRDLSHPDEAFLLSKDGGRQIAEYRKRAQQADIDDDVIADTSILLNRDGGWERVWHKQVSPLIEDLRAVPGQLDAVPQTTSLPAAAALRQFASEREHTLDALSGEVLTRQADMDTALDTLRQTRDEFNQLITDLRQETAEKAGGSNRKKRDMILGGFSDEDMKDTRRTQAQGTIYSTAYEQPYISVFSFSAGYSAGQSAYTASTVSSSSSSGSGYSGGGSFSGSGSSSSF